LKCDGYDFFSMTQRDGQGRRRFLEGASILILAGIAGCTGDGGSGGGETGGDGELTDSVIDADVGDVIVTLDDLEAGWSGVEPGEGDAYFLNEGKDVEIAITDHSDISPAKTAYDDLKAENTDNTASDDVSYGHEGFLVKPYEDYVMIGFRAANFVVKIDSYTQESSLANPEEFGREFAKIIIGKMVDAQNN
jgi:hypothetical protein